jgi:DNA polymerase-3 subunit delta'
VPFESLLGNEAALARLSGLLERDRPAHAYLFSGPEGVGKKTAALDFARVWGAAPRLVGLLEDKHEILIAQIHEVIREFNFASLERRAVIFDNAHRMSEEAMNAILKTLEEPPGQTIIILVSSVPQRLLGTIRSRCQTVLFFPLTDEAIARHARERLGLGEEEARAVAALAEGSIGAATALAPEIGEVLTQARGLQERVLSGELNPLIESLGKIRDTEQARRTARRYLGLLAACLREVLHASVGALPCLSTPAFLERMSRLDPDDLLDRIEMLIDHQRLIDLNANVSLVVEDAFLRI